MSSPSPSMPDQDSPPASTLAILSAWYADQDEEETPQIEVSSPSAPQLPVSSTSTPQGGLSVVHGVSSSTAPQLPVSSTSTPQGGSSVVHGIDNHSVLLLPQIWESYAVHLYGDEDDEDNPAIQQTLQTGESSGTSGFIQQTLQIGESSGTSGFIQQTLQIGESSGTMEFGEASGTNEVGGGGSPIRVLTGIIHNRARDSVIEPLITTICKGILTLEANFRCEVCKEHTKIELPILSCAFHRWASICPHQNAMLAGVMPPDVEQPVSRDCSLCFSRKSSILVNGKDEEGGYEWALLFLGGWIGNIAPKEALIELVTELQRKLVPTERRNRNGLLARAYLLIFQALVPDYGVVRALLFP